MDDACGREITTKLILPTSAVNGWQLIFRLADHEREIICGPKSSIDLVRRAKNYGGRQESSNNSMKTRIAKVSYCRKLHFDIMEMF